VREARIDVFDPPLEIRNDDRRVSLFDGPPKAVQLQPALVCPRACVERVEGIRDIPRQLLEERELLTADEGLLRGVDGETAGHGAAAPDGEGCERPEIVLQHQGPPRCNRGVDLNVRDDRRAPLPDRGSERTPALGRVVQAHFDPLEVSGLVPGARDRHDPHRLPVGAPDPCERVAAVRNEDPADVLQERLLVRRTLPPPR
jgi:hypothetical protein